MTNAEKYLKDGVDGIRPLLDKCREIGAIDSGREFRIDQMLRDQATPTLTEDERVILRNIAYDSEYKYIYRSLGMLYLSENEKLTCVDRLPAMHHLFQFIKERRRISY